MTTLVTGATGFIGGNLARRLAARGEDVRALVRPTANDVVIRDVAVKQSPGDLLDVESLRRAVKGCETVYHCAATYSFWAKRPGDIYDTNVAGTQNLLDAARSAGVRRVVFTSSVSTVGLPGGVGVEPGELGSEEIPANPTHLIGHYKQSKYAAEQVALAANGDGLEVVVVNPCAPVGKWDVKPTPTGRIPLDFARGRIPGYLDTGMNLVDVSDVAEGHILAMERGRPGRTLHPRVPEFDLAPSFRNAGRNHRTPGAPHSFPILVRHGRGLLRPMGGKRHNAPPAGNPGGGY